YRHVQAERLRSFEIDGQNEINRSLDGKVARLRALEDTIGILCCTPKIIDLLISIGQQASQFSIETEWAYSRETVVSCQRCDFRAMGICEGIWHDNKTTIRIACVGGNYGFELGRAANCRSCRRYSEGRSGIFERLQIIVGISRRC